MIYLKAENNIPFPTVRLYRLAPICRKLPS